MTKLSECFSFDLSYTLTGNIKLLTNLFECAGATVLKTETELNNLLFSGSEGVEDVTELLTEQGV
jgi:hypothetical protein